MTGLFSITHQHVFLLTGRCFLGHLNFKVIVHPWDAYWPSLANLLLIRPASHTPAITFSAPLVFIYPLIRGTRANISPSLLLESVAWGRFRVNLLSSSLSVLLEESKTIYMYNYMYITMKNQAVSPYCTGLYIRPYVHSGLLRDVRLP